MGRGDSPYSITHGPPCRVLYTKFKYNAGTPKFYDPIPYFNVRQCGVCIRDGVEVEVQLQVRMFFRLGLVKI